jgi:integrase
MGKDNGRISEDFIRKLDPPARGQRIYWDDKIPGFGVRINSGGAIAFVLNYTMNKKRRRFRIGRYPNWNATTARNKAKALSVGVDEGINPQEKKRQSDSEPTFKELAEQYLKRAETHKRAGSLRNDRGNINRLLQREWGTLQVKAISQRNIEALQREHKATPYHANRMLALLSSMFNLAVKWGWRSDNPVKGITKFHEDRRERWLSLEELGNLDRALAIYKDQNAADSIRLLLLTGAREMEVLKADWSQFDLERGVWTKPSHATKQKKIEHIPLNEPALALLRRMKSNSSSGPLFPGATGSARVTLRRPWRQICKTAGLAQAVELKGKRRMITRYKPTVRIHDLRHTYASHLVSNGVSLQVVGKLLGHTRVQTTERYAHLANAALQDGTNRFGEIFASASGKGK